MSGPAPAGAGAERGDHPGGRADLRRAFSWAGLAAALPYALIGGLVFLMTS
ncbi:MAG: hypothetical protein U0Z44_18325 [Kouleothrix sp.]